MAEKHKEREEQFDNRVKLYKVIREWGSNQGYFEKHGEKVLYCGYERLEAVRVYEAERQEDDSGSPGSSYRSTRLLSKSVRAS